MICEGDTVAHRWTFTGTHQGEMMGVEPTGRRVEVAGVGDEPRRERQDLRLLDGLGRPGPHATTRPDASPEENG
jgi:hypothetical protein